MLLSFQMALKNRRFLGYLEVRLSGVLEMYRTLHKMYDVCSEQLVQITMFPQT